MRVSSTAKKLLLVGIIFIGAYLRMHAIVDLPPGDDFDPAYYGLDALRILDGERPIYLATNYGREPMFSYVVAGLYLILGRGSLGIHLAAAFIAILTIPALYLAGEEFLRFRGAGVLREWGGVLAALVLAISYWHLNWSRYGVRAVIIPLLFSLICFFLLRGFRRRKMVDFVIAGLLMGIGFYTYQLAQVVPIWVFLFFLVQIKVQEGHRREIVGFMLLVFGIAFLLSVPIFQYAYNHPGVFNQRFSDVFVVNPSVPLSEQLPVVVDRVRQALLMFVYEGDASATSNLPGRPVFNPFYSFFLVVGVIICCKLWRQTGPLFLLIWLAIMIIPAVLADKAPMAKRALGALPAAVIVVSLGMLWPLQVWTERRE